jgi:hypothetical protein
MATTSRNLKDDPNRIAAAQPDVVTAMQAMLSQSVCDRLIQNRPERQSCASGYTRG